MNHILLLHEKLVMAAASLRSAEAEIFKLLLEFDSMQAWLSMGASSLFDYCVRFLKMTESQTAAYSQVLYKSKTVPALKEAVFKEEIPISKLRRICPVIEQETSEHWLRVAENSTYDRLADLVARESPAQRKRPVIRNIGSGMQRLHFDATEAMVLQIGRLKEIFGTSDLQVVLAKALGDSLQKRDKLALADRVLQKKAGKLGAGSKEDADCKRAASCIGSANDESRLVETGSALGQMVPTEQIPNTGVKTSPGSVLGQIESRRVPDHCRERLPVTEPQKPVQGIPHQRTAEPYQDRLQKPDSSIRTQQIKAVKPNQEKPAPAVPVHPARTDSPVKRTAIPRTVAHTVMQRDQGQCQHMGITGMQCKSRWFLEVHHIKPVSRGGKNEVKNLITLCGRHHQMRHG